jgi:hypothetical protein
MIHIKLGIAQAQFFRDNGYSDKNHLGGFLAAIKTTLCKPLTNSFSVGGFIFCAEKAAYEKSLQYPWDRHKDYSSLNTAVFFR